MFWFAQGPASHVYGALDLSPDEGGREKQCAWGHFLIFMLGWKAVELCHVGWLRDCGDGQVLFLTFCHVIAG